MRTSLALALLVAACSSARPAVSPVVARPASPAPIASAPAAPSAAAPAPPSPLAPSTLPTTWDVRKQASHALERLAYGARPGDVTAIATAGVEGWIRRQMRPSSIADDVVEAKLRELPTLVLSPAELHAKYPRANNATAADRRPIEMERELAAQKILRAVDSERQLQEVLVDFWFNHFNVFSGKGADRWLVGPYERDAIRPHVFGRFRELLGAVAHHPAMLFYLDNWLSVADAASPTTPNAGGLNENYGRELLELHTLGVDGGYSQADVRETARAFTGWSITRPNVDALPVFHGKKHDDGAKTILGHAFASGGGEGDGEAALDLVAAHPATARFLARKLCTKFVADDPPAALVERVAGAFLESGGDLVTTYQAIVFAPELWSDAADGNKTKTPLELAASAARAIGATVTPDNALPAWIARMGEPLYRAQPPTGYKETSDAWVSTGALVARIDFGLALAAGRVKGVSFDREKLVGAAPPDDAGQLVDRLAGIVVPRPLAPATRDTIVAQLEATSRGVTYQEASPSELPQALGLLLGSPELQKQ